MKKLSEYEIHSISGHSTSCLIYDVKKELSLLNKILSYEKEKELYSKIKRILVGELSKI